MKKVFLTGRKVIECVECKYDELIAQLKGIPVCNNDQIQPGTSLYIWGKFLPRQYGEWNHPVD